MPKCKFCMPAGDVDYVAGICRKDEEPKIEPGSPVVCNNNAFPGYDFCPEHLSARGVNITKLTAEYIANKEE